MLVRLYQVADDRLDAIRHHRVAAIVRVNRVGHPVSVTDDAIENVRDEAGRRTARECFELLFERVVDHSHPHADEHDGRTTEANVLDDHREGSKGFRRWYTLQEIVAAKQDNDNLWVS